MSESYLLTDFLKSLPTASSLSGLSMICVDGSGNLKKGASSLIGNMAMETPGPNVVSNIDQLTVPGLYGTGLASEAQGTFPATGNWDYALVEVIGRWTMTVQRITNASGQVASRTGKNMNWSTWKILG